MILQGRPGCARSQQRLPPWRWIGRSFCPGRTYGATNVMDALHHSVRTCTPRALLIMFDANDYPSDWTEVRAAKLRDCGGQCECNGECGRPNHPGRCTNRNGEAAWGTGSKVVLTMAHLNRPGDVCACKPLCSMPEHLKLMCNGCHLAYDIEMHVQKAYQTRMRKKNVVEMDL